MRGSMMTTLPTLNTSSVPQTSITSDNTVVASSNDSRSLIRMVWIVVPSVLIVMGTFGNVMTIVVMRAMRASESLGCLPVYFSALAVSDLFLLWINALWYQPNRVVDTYSYLPYGHNVFCTVPFFVSYVSSLASAWFLVAFTCQRMTSVVLPHRVEVLCTVRNGEIITVIIAVMCCAVNMYIFFYYEAVYTGKEILHCKSTESSVKIFGFLNLSLSSVVPFLLLIIANIVLTNAVVQSLKMASQMTRPGHTHPSSRSAKVSSMTVTLILTSTAFLFLTLPSYVLWMYFEVTGFYEGQVTDQNLRNKLSVVESFCTLMRLSNSSVNFYIYILSGRKFREEAKRAFDLCCKRQQMSKNKVLE